jgi:hypothetical protein
LLLFIFIIITVTLACSLPFEIVFRGTGGDNQQAAEGAEAKDDDNQAGRSPKSERDDEDETVQESEQQQASLTETPSLTPSPTATLTPTVTLTPTNTLTPTPEKVVGFISKNTNCRLGPKDMYELIHIFKKGQNVELLGKNEEDSFWYVQDQNGGTIKCWLWKKYTTPEGSTANLPVFTPPPSPIPVLNFVLSYKQTTGKTTVHVYVQNTGNIALQSYSATFKDLNTSEVVTGKGNKFGTMAKVSVGNTGVVSSKPFSASTIGHQIRATIKACSDDNQSGKCYSDTITFESK